MPKNIVVFCDGTKRSAFDFLDDMTSNVAGLYSLSVGEEEQVAFYHSGIGTSPFGGALKNLLGRATGYAIHRDVEACYDFISQQYVAGDKVFLFGFSRGGFVVRAVASVLYAYGASDGSMAHFSSHAINSLRELRYFPRTPKGLSARATALDDNQYYFQPFTRPCPVHFVGVWDSVASVWGRTVPHIMHNPGIAIARQALALDERRGFFTPVLWRSHETCGSTGCCADVQQVWFPGCHSDIGGGYPLTESRLSQIAFDWMLQEAIHAGLRVDLPHSATWFEGRHASVGLRPVIHRSLTGGWRATELVPVRHYDWTSRSGKWTINGFRRRELPPRPLIHDSAWSLGEEYTRKLPSDALYVGSRRLILK
jgi:uncharacterized protein (DUF2235 family)